MNFNKLITFISILFLLTITVGTIYAADDINNTIIEDNALNNNLNNNTISLDNSNDILQSNEYINDELSVNSEEIISDSSSTSKSITIVADKKNPNQVLNPTVQPVIDEANAGDTIILKGNFVHCHFTIDKPLNIVASTGTTLGPCPHHQSEGAGSYGVFYVIGNGSGSVIEGFTFLNNDQSETPYSFLIRGASNVTIKDCTMNFVDPDKDKYVGIIIENSTNVTISNCFINNTINGIAVNDSSDIYIIDNVMTNNENQAIWIFGENSSNINICNNTIKGNGNNGINLASANYINVINNLIEDNGLDNNDVGSGIYVNTNITKLVVKGNIFLSNGLHGIMYDYRTRNLNNDVTAPGLTTIDNNYFTGHSSMILHHRTYVKDANGFYSYDAENDTFIATGNGDYTESKSYSYMLHSFVVADSICGYTYYDLNIPWDSNAPGNNGKYDLALYLSNITQIKKGIYEVSIVDSKGNIAQDLSSFNVTFYLNDFSTAIPKQTEIYKIVKIEKGTATVDFTDLKEKYLETGNIITAAFPGFTPNVLTNSFVQLKLNDSDIPSNVISTKIDADDFNTEYAIPDYLVVNISDINNNNLKNILINVDVNGKNYNITSDENGQIKILIDFNVGSYDVVIKFLGNDDYDKSTKTVKVVVSKATPKITAATLTTYPLSDDYLKVKLTGNNGKALPNQKVSFKINGKSISAKTDSNGVAKVKVSLTTKKTYSVTVTYAGNANYKNIKKTVKVVVKTGSKKSKISASNIKVKKNTKKTFSLKLTSSAGKAISKQKVTVKLNGKTYTVKTNTKGVAKLSFKLTSAKKYKVSMKFLGNSNYKAASKTSIITVTKK